MAQISSSRPRPRRSMVLALLTTTAAASLLGACGQTDKLFSRGPAEDVQLSATEAVGATAKWAEAYAKKPEDPRMALGYAKALKAIGSRDKALQILTASYRANPAGGEVAAELGRLALDMGRMEIAMSTLKAAEAQGVHDWKTLSAQGTLQAKQGQHAEAQEYYLAALEEKPDALSVINNLALSYALDGKAKKSEDLLRKAVASGHEDRRVRQNLALVLGLQGKFDEARQVASVDMDQTATKSSMAYLRNMLSNPTRVASAPAKAEEDQGEDWQPFASNAPVKEKPAVRTAATAPEPKPKPKVQIVKPVEDIEAPAPAAAAKTTVATAAPAPTPISPPKPAGNAKAAETVASKNGSSLLRASQ